MRGIVVGDVFRRVVARTIAQTIHQKGGIGHGCKTVAHIFQVLTNLDPDARNSTMESLRRVVDGEQILPSVSFSRPAFDLFVGRTTVQRDPMMPLLAPSALRRQPFGNGRKTLRTWAMRFRKTWFFFQCFAMQSAAESVLPHRHCVARRFPTQQQVSIVQRFLDGNIAEHRVLLERIHEVPGTQSVWSLLCAAAPTNLFLRGVNP